MFTLKRNVLAISQTVEQAHHVVGVWQTVIEKALYSTGSDGALLTQYKQALADMTDSADRSLVEQLGTDWLTTINQENFHEFLEEVREWLARVPTFVVYVPVELDDTGIGILHEWVRAEVGEEWLLELRVTANVLGGCAFIKDDHYHDYSLLGQLRKNPEMIAEIFSAYE